MKNSITTFLFMFCATLCIAQLPQKYDSLYKTIFAKDLCQMLEQNHQN